MRHIDRGRQEVSFCYTERLAHARVEASVGGRSDSYDAVLAETIDGLYKTEVISHRGPWRNVDAVEYATLKWVDCHNHRRLLKSIGNVPAAELEATYNRQREESALATRFTRNGLWRNWGDSFPKCYAIASFWSWCGILRLGDDEQRHRANSWRVRNAGEIFRAVLANHLCCDISGLPPFVPCKGHHS